jgi:O-acetyl-ADP-ribose deacetylase (regulator of RNase III)
MIRYKQGNLLTANTEALVNTVNTLGIMGKGIALMFKEHFPENMKLYRAACKDNLVQTGKMFVTAQETLEPHWIINFPTKQHWRNPSKMEWIISGLKDLREFIVNNKIKSIAIPPLGAGNGGLLWPAVREQIETILGDLENVDIQLYEPTDQYQNMSKPTSLVKLTPAKALITELVRRYWILGVECSLLEIQKLAWFLERSIKILSPELSLKFNFKPHYYGPYADNLRYLLGALDGNYLRSDKRINDAKPLDVIWFDDDHRDPLQKYLESDEMSHYKEALEFTSKLIDGFESPFEMELLATIDWLIEVEKCSPNTESLLMGLRNWKHAGAAKRKVRLFDSRAISVALKRLEIIKQNKLQYNPVLLSDNTREL